MAKMKAVFIRKETGSLIVRETEIPKPGAGEVLVKIAAAPINPSDTAGIKDALNGVHDLDTFIPGNEGSGTVVSAGKGLLPTVWKGKRVACASKGEGNGTWAEYVVTKAGNCYPLDKNVSDEQGSMTLVNPLTALAFIEMAREGNHKAIINNAAASALGRMVELLCKKEGIPLVNIVRRDEQVKALKDTGSEYVLNSSGTSFVKDLQSLSDKLGATILFDSVSGPGFPEITEALPYGSRVVIYGSLSPDQYVSVDPRKLLAKDITISGFYLGNQAKKNGLIKNLMNLRKVSKLMRTEMKINIRAGYPLDKAQEAVDEYLKNMTAGKIILQP